MSVAQYAEARNADEETVRHQIRIGVIKPPVRGLIDVEQADQSWGRIRRARIDVPKNDDQGRRSAEAKIVGGLAKLRLAKDRLDATKERYVSRKDAVTTAGEEIAAFIAALEEIPKRHAVALAAALAIDPAVARSLLERFIRLAIDELGDLQGEAMRAAEAA